jgi:hypothetical protein
LPTSLLLVASLAGAAGCGGGSGSNTASGTPLGTTNPTITLTNAGISHSLVFTLTVN